MTFKEWMKQLSNERIFELEKLAAEAEGQREKQEEQ